MNPSGCCAPRMRQIWPERRTEFDQVLAGHLVVHAKRGPAHRPVRLPLQLAVPARHGHLRQPPGIGILVDDRARSDVAVDDRHLQHAARGRRDRQERTVGRAPLRAERRQDHVADRVVIFEHLEQRYVEAAGNVALGGRHELVVEGKRVEKRLEPRIVVLAEARMVAEGVRYLGQRPPEMLGQHIPVGNVVGHFS